MPIALLSCVTLPEPDPDEQPLLEALQAADLGDRFAPELVGWDDPTFDPADYELCIIRATWNYAHHVQAFRSVIRRADAESVLWNPAGVVRWNLNKTYLRELSEAGIPIIPTEWINTGEADRFVSILAEHDWDDIVVKPSISAGSYLTRRFTIDRFDEAEAFIASYTSEDNPTGAARAMMVQKYMPSVETEGERAIVWVDGELTHAIHKHPRFDDQDEVVEPAELTSELRGFADMVMGMVPGGCQYARIDVIRDEDGGLCLAELELIEPSLFFEYGPEALERMVEAIKRFATEAVAS